MEVKKAVEMNPWIDEKEDNNMVSQTWITKYITITKRSDNIINSAQWQWKNGKWNLQQETNPTQGKNSKRHLPGRHSRHYFLLKQWWRFYHIRRKYTKNYLFRCNRKRSNTPCTWMIWRYQKVWKKVIKLYTKY